MTFAPRLFLSYLLVLFVGLATAALVLSNLLINYENDLSRARLQELSAPLVTGVQIGLRSGAQPRAIVEALAEQARAADARLLVADTQRRVAVDGDARMLDQRLPEADRTGFGSFTDRGEDWLYVQEPLRPPSTGFVVVARPRAAFGDSLRLLAPSLLAGTAVAAAVGLAAAALLAGSIAHSLRRLAATARRFAGRDYEARALVEGPPETRQVARAFNEMAEEIARARGTERSFLADLSHELRTPLTAIHGFAQAIGDGEARGEEVERAASVIRRESRRLVRMVEGLLEVARLEAGATTLELEDVDPARAIADAVDVLEPQAKEGGVALDVAMEGSLPRIRADRDRVTQLLLNVIDNAVRHAPRGSAVRIRAARESGAIVIRVRDEGGGIPGTANGRLFERYWHGEQETGGTGLGLAIARAIAEAHGGGVDARNTEGGGAEFTVRLAAP